jgi:toxin-antitoxin system PIN domain toxin
MLSFDTNIAVHAANAASPFHARAVEFIQSLAVRKDVANCELVLVEPYLKLRNEKIFSRPLSAAQAAAVCQSYRKNRSWMLIESAPVMPKVWRQAALGGFPFRRIIDLRLALTLRHHGVTEFATSNEKDFKDVGFSRLWNPLVV